MGIRYYAYPLAPKFAELARIDPLPFLSDDPFADVFFMGADERPNMLYLDKCWRWLQGLTRPEGGGPARASHRLFEGNVTPMDGGYTWLPWARSLGPDETADVAQDLATLTESDIRALIMGSRLPEDEHDDEFSYISSYLKCARDFTQHLSDRQWGLVYMIG